MSLVPLPKELYGVKFIQNPITRDWELPPNATEEQKAALIKLEENMKKARDEMVTFEE